MVLTEAQTNVAKKKRKLQSSVKSKFKLSSVPVYSPKTEK